MATTYYVLPGGDDTNNTGLSPVTPASSPTTGTPGPFKTMSKGINACAPGDTVYVGPGVYRTAGPSVTASGSSGSPINVIGDPGNSQGFKDSSGVLIPPGEVRLTSFDVNDTTTPTAGNLLTLTSVSYINFSNLWFVAGLSTAAQGAIYITGSHDLNFTLCLFTEGVAQSSSYSLFMATNGGVVAMNFTIDRCLFWGCGSNHINFSLRADAASGDYDTNNVIQNCLFIGGSTHISLTKSASGTGAGGGIRVRNCTFGHPRSNHISLVSGLAANNAVYCYNSTFLSTGVNVFSGATSTTQVVENYNVYPVTSTSVTAGGNSKLLNGSICPLLDVGQWALWGQNPRPFMVPTASSPFLGFGNDASGPSVDFLNRPRPEGGKSLSKAIGYLERHDTAVQETTVVDSGSSIRIDGPGSQEFQIPVDATTTTISVKCRYDANHGTTTPPQAVLVAAPELGVTTQTVTAASTTDTWLTLSFAAITPTAKGVVRIRLVARPAAANGKCYFDTVTVS